MILLDGAYVLKMTRVNCLFTKGASC